MQNLVTSKEVSEKLKKLGVRQESYFKYCGGHTMYDEDDDGKFEECPNDALLGDDEYCETASLTCEFITRAYTISELEEPLKPYMKDIEISARDDIFNPDFWGNYLISKLSEKGNE